MKPNTFTFLVDSKFKPQSPTHVSFAISLLDKDDQLLGYHRTSISDDFATHQARDGQFPRLLNHIFIFAKLANQFIDPAGPITLLVPETNVPLCEYIMEQKEHIEQMLYAIYTRKIIVSVVTGSRFESALDRLKDFVSIAYEEGLRELPNPCSRTTWEPRLFN